MEHDFSKKGFGLRSSTGGFITRLAVRPQICGRGRTALVIPRVARVAYRCAYDCRRTGEYPSIEKIVSVACLSC